MISEALMVDTTDMSAISDTGVDDAVVVPATQRPTTWRGRHIHYSDMYPRVYWPQHPMAPKSGLVRIHRVVAFEKVGRVLLQNEHVHHIDRNPMNWCDDNIVVVTPSGHSKIHHTEDDPDMVIRLCATCGKEVSRPPSKIEITERSFCDHVCQGKYMRRMAEWPESSKLSEMIWQYPASVIASQIGVSGAALKKHCKKLCIETPPRGYWSIQRKIKNNTVVSSW